VRSMRPVCLTPSRIEREQCLSGLVLYYSNPQYECLACKRTRRVESLAVHVYGLSSQSEIFERGIKALLREAPSCNCTSVRCRIGAAAQRKTRSMFRRAMGGGI
jgi:hypothetical protein